MYEKDMGNIEIVFTIWESIAGIIGLVIGGYYWKNKHKVGGFWITFMSLLLFSVSWRGI